MNGYSSEPFNALLRAMLLTSNQFQEHFAENLGKIVILKLFDASCAITQIDGLNTLQFQALNG
jgi:hypothetical protein